MRIARTITAPIALLMIAASLGCSGDDEAAVQQDPPEVSVVTQAAPGDGDATSFCEFINDIDQAGKEATKSGVPGRDVLRTFRPRFTQALADAPAAMKPHVQTMIDASNAAIESNDLGDASDDDVATASLELNNFCSSMEAPK